MRFKPAMAPVKCMIANLQSNDAFTPFVKRIADALTASPRVEGFAIMVGSLGDEAAQVRSSATTCR